MQQLATAIRGRAESLVDQYDVRLRTMAGYSRLPESMRRELERHVLDLIAQCLETADASALVEYVGQRASQWAAMGLDLAWFQQALTVLEDILVPLIDSAEASTFLWQALNRSQSAVWQMVAERAHKAEQTLRQSQQLLQSVMDNIPQAVFWKDRNLIYLGCNRAFAEDAGLASPTEIVGKTDHDMPWQPQADLYRADDRLVMDSGTPKLDYEEPQTTPNGSTIWLRTSKVPMRDTTGNVTAVLGMYEDITKRKRAEEALRQSEENYRTILENIQDGYFEVDLAGNFTFFNDALCGILGYPRDELRGMNNREYMDTENAKAVYRVFNEVYRTRRPSQTFSYEVFRKDGTRRLVEVSASLITDSTGEPIRFQGVMRDITERKRAEEALHQSEAQLSEAMRIAHLAYWEYDVEKDLFLFNDQFYSIFHTTAEREGGYQLSSAQYAQRFVHPDDLPVVGTEIERALNSTDRHYSRPLEHRILYADGGVGYISVNINIDRDEQGRILRYYGANQDITQQKLAEEALAHEQYLMNALMNNLPDTIYFKDKQSRFIRISQSQSVRFGFSDPAQAIGKTDFDFFTEEHARPAYEDEQQIIQTGQPITKEERETWPDRADTWVLTTKLPLLDEAGNIVGTFGISKDISERRQAEEAIKEEQRRSQAILETVTVPMIISRLSDSKVLYANQALAQFRHMALDELIGSHTTDYFVNPDDRNKLVEILRRQSYATDFETQLRGSGGAVSWVLLSARIINFQNETCVLSSYVDITDRKQAEAERERLLTDQQKRALQLQTAAEVSRAASSILSLDELLPQATELVRTRFNLYYVGIFLVDESGQWATLRAGTGEAGQQMLTAGHKLKVGGSSMISWCIVNRQARIALDVGEEAVRFDNPLLPLTRSEAALPLISRGSVIGAVTIQSEQQAAFTAEDITVLQTMADQISNATENARLFEQAQAALQEVDAINRRLTGEAWESYLRHRSSQQVIWVSDNDESAPAPLLKADETLSTGQIVVEPEEDKSQATVTAPIMLRGQTIGALRMQTPSAEWNEDIQTLLTSIAGHIAQAAENTRLLEVTQERFARERALAEATDKIRRSTEVERVLETAAAELARYLNANTVAVHMSSNAASDGDEKPRDRIVDPNR